MRQLNTGQRMQMLYSMLPPTRPADQTMIDGWKQDDITVAMHDLRRARVQWRRGRQAEARAWLQVAEQIVSGIFQAQGDFGEIEEDDPLDHFRDTDPGDEDPDDMDPFTSANPDPNDAFGALPISVPYDPPAI